MLQIKHLQVGDGRVAGIHFVPLGDHFFRKIVGPVVLVVLHLRKRGAETLLGCHCFPLIQQFVRSLMPPVCFVFVPQVSAQKVVSQRQPVFHDFVANASMVCTSTSVEATAERALYWRCTVKILMTNRNSMIARIEPNPQIELLTDRHQKSLHILPAADYRLHSAATQQRALTRQRPVIGWYPLSRSEIRNPVGIRA